MRTVIWSVGAILGLLIATNPVNADDAREVITRLAMAYDAAIVARDAEALGTLFDDDGRFIDTEGRVFDKAGYIAEYTDPETTYESTRVEDRSIRDFGDVAVETGTFLANGTKEGKPFEERVRFTAVWIRRGESWVVTSEQATQIVDGT